MACTTLFGVKEESRLILSKEFSKTKVGYNMHGNHNFT